MEYIKLLDNPIEQTEILNKDSSFIISSYYWGINNVNPNSVRNLTYGQQVERLINQCRKFKINYYIARYPIIAEKKLYQIALGLKGVFVENTLKKFPNYKVINLDSDLQILQYPHLFEIDADCFFINWSNFDDQCFNPYQLELPGGILGFSNSPNSRALLSLLNEHMISHLHLAEDKSFSGIITRHFLSTYLRCVWLPINYMYMFDRHIYDPSLGMYTFIATLEEDLYDNEFKFVPNDIVIIHEDFETGALSDVFEKRVGTVNRFPPNAYRQLGEKLRCLDNIKFKNYINYNLNEDQYKQLYKDFLWREKNHLSKNLMITPINEININTYLLRNSTDKLNSTGPLIVSILNKDSTEDSINKFINSCDEFGFDYVIFNKINISKPILFYNVLKRFNRNIMYVDINTKIKRNPELFHVKNMDFMTINLDNTSIDGKVCSDMRILKMLNDNLYFFANNNVVYNLLAIWNEHITKKNMKSQHKALEYAFNISISTNKLRCYYFPKTYILGPVLSYPKEYTFSFFNNVYSSVSQTFKKLTNKLSQCGLKPALEYGEPLPTHYHGSPHGTIYHNKYGKKFLQF